MAGSFGIANIFSFFPTKTITTCEGGIITTNEESIYKLSKEYRDQGKRLEDGLHIHYGNSWRMSELHSIVGISQLQSCLKDTIYRNKIINMYKKMLKECEGISFPFISKKHITSGHKCVAYVNSYEIKKSLIAYLKEKDIFLGKGIYDIPLHKQPIFMKDILENYPKADDFSQKHICLPLWRNISQKEVNIVVQGIKAFFGY